jgi:hypothetical protein
MTTKADEEEDAENDILQLMADEKALVPTEIPTTSSLAGPTTTMNMKGHYNPRGHRGSKQPVELPSHYDKLTNIPKNSMKIVQDTKGLDLSTSIVRYEIYKYIHYTASAQSDLIVYISVCTSRFLFCIYLSCVVLLYYPGCPFSRWNF